MEAVNTHIASIPKVIDGQAAMYFDAMMDEGIQEIEHLARNQWTNYNASDPGITMLEYLSYGLLNLGYKASMPIADLLTGADEEIDPGGRFFTPSEIMFTNPVTINDFRKLLLDRVGHIKNIWIEPGESSGTYKVSYEMLDARDMELHNTRFYREFLGPLNLELANLISSLKTLEFPDPKGELAPVGDTDAKNGADLYCAELKTLIQRQKDALPQLKDLSNHLSEVLQDLDKLLLKSHPETRWNSQKKALLEDLAPLLEKVATLYQQYRQMPDAIDALLMQHRNLGEYFEKSEIVRRSNVRLSTIFTGIVLEPEANADEMLANMIYAINNYFSPFIERYTYTELTAEGKLTDQILNGPELSNGYIKDQSLQKERGQWNIVVLSRLVSEVAGIQKVYMKEQEVPNDRKGIHYIDPYDPKLFNGTSIYLGKNELNAPELTSVAQCYSALVKQNVFPGGLPANELYPVMPIGNYRNIQEYYSVQNLFPTFYGLDNARDLSGATAEIKQLKAYLMLFEQIMADHQSQIAGVPDLLGFGKESIKELRQTYLSQGLYNSPGAEVILRAFDGFKQENSATENNSSLNWDDFINSTSNGYISDLEAIQATEGQQVARKNTFLSHRLATVGEQFDTDNIIGLNPNYGNYQQARIETIDRLLENFPLTSQSIARSYFSHENPAKILLAGLEIKLDLLFNINGYYQSLLDIINKLPKEPSKKISENKSDDLDKSSAEWDCGGGIKLKLSDKEWTLVYRKGDMVRIPAVNQHPDLTEGRLLMKGFSSVLRSLISQTEGFVLIDTIMLDASHFQQPKPKKKQQQAQGVSIYLPEEVTRVTRHDFYGMLWSTLVQEGPMTQCYSIRALKYKDIEKLLVARRAWLKGIMVLQGLWPETKSKSKANCSDDQKILAKAARAVGKIKTILNDSKPLMNCDAET